MFGFSIRTRQNNVSASPRTTDSPRVTAGSPASAGSPRHMGTPGTKGSPKQVEVGEIDTSAPFQSVKAAVSLFREAGASPMSQPATIKKSAKTLEERVLVKETQLHLIMKELDGLKEQLRNTEATKLQALRDLEKAKRTLHDLTSKLETVCEAKQAAIESTEAAKVKAKELEMQKSSKPAAISGDDAWKLHVDSEREQYKASAGELNYAKQELANLRQDFDAVLEAKLSAFQEAADAHHLTAVNRERANEFAKEVSALRETLAQVKLAPLQAQEENAKLNAEKESHLHSLKMAKEEADRKLSILREEADPAVNKSLAEKLEETNAMIEVLREQLNNVKVSDNTAWREVSAEKENAERALQEIRAEEESLKSLVDSLREELENVNKLRAELRNKAEETDSLAERLRVELDRNKKELEATIAGITKQEEEINAKIQELSLEADRATREAEDMKKSADIFKQEAEAARIATRAAEEKLEVALKEAEEAKAAQRVADYKIHNASRKFTACNGEEDQAAAANISEPPNGGIKLSNEEYQSLCHKVEKLKTEADIKVATVMAQVESINRSEKDLVKKVEERMREAEEVEAATRDAVKRAEVDEAAKLVVEGELLRWRHEEGNNLVAEETLIEGR
ncbi:unnamed protein product [Cuscuta epithymum]|uniref:WEB family protein n=1 Tax=Cuscuta epithymum TaxID=186058 RepID=A0AAV0FDV3_9ASTE|nr:unnamed protein product [Cuscuta epithymum]